MTSVSASGSDKPSEADTVLLRAVISVAVNNGFRGTVDDLDENLRQSQVPEHLLGNQYFRTRANLLGLLGGANAARTHLGPDHEPTHPPTPPETADGDKHISAQADAVPGFEPEADGGAPTVVEEDLSGKPFLVSASVDGGTSSEWDGFFARRCRHKRSFITADTARRLGLDPTIGGQYKLAWFAQKRKPEKKTRRIFFTVVSNDAMNVDIAFGSDWLASIEVGPEDQRIGLSQAVPVEKVDSPAPHMEPLPLSQQSGPQSQHDDSSALLSQVMARDERFIHMQDQMINNQKQLISHQEQLMNMQKSLLDDHHMLLTHCVSRDSKTASANMGYFGSALSVPVGVGSLQKEPGG